MRSHLRRACTILVLSALVVFMAVPAWGKAKPTGVAPAALEAQGVTAQAWFGPDQYESADDTWTTAPVLPAVSYHTLESVDATGNIGYTSDVDWFKVTVDATGTPIYVRGERLGGIGQDLWLDVFVDDGTGKPDTTRDVSEDDTYWPWRSGSTTGVPRLFYTADAPGTYWLRMYEIESQTAARDFVPAPRTGSCEYELSVTTGSAARVSGADRYQTNVEVSRLMWPESDNPYWWTYPDGAGVIVASGENYPDAVAAGALSVQTGMPLLLTKPTMLPADLSAEISRLAVGAYWNSWDSDFDVYICGGTGAISNDIATKIAKNPYVTSVSRLAGSARAGTAAAIADEAGANSDVFLANGWSFADALSAGPVAGWAGQPILYSAETTVPAETLAWMTTSNVTNITVCGGTSAISDAVLDAIQAAVPGVQTFVRVAGDTRYETSYALAAFGVDTYGMNAGMPIVASGEGFPDGLSATQFSYMTGGPVLLTPAGVLSEWIQVFYDDYGPFDDAVYVVGGTRAFGVDAFNDLNDMWMTPTP